MSRTIKLGLLLFLVLAIVIYGFISFQITSGLVETQRKPLEDNAASFGLEFTDIDFPSRVGGNTLNGWYIPPGDKGPAVIFVHGVNANREEDGDFLNIAARLTEEGYGVLLFDLRGHGRSEGETVSAGYFERQDVLGAFDYLKAQGISPERIGLLGFSMGAATALLAAAEEPSLKAVVADSPFADISDLLAQETARKTPFPEWLVPVFIPGVEVAANLFYSIKIAELAPEDAVSGMDYPIFLIHSTGDSRIPSDHSVRIHAAAHPDSTIWLVQGLEHTDAYPTYPDEYMTRILEYYEERLGLPQ